MFYLSNRKILKKCKSIFIYIYIYVFILEGSLLKNHTWPPPIKVSRYATDYTVNASPCSLHIGSGLKNIMIVALFSSVYQVTECIAVSFEVSKE